MFSEMGGVVDSLCEGKFSQVPLILFDVCSLCGL